MIFRNQDIKDRMVLVSASALGLIVLIFIVLFFSKPGVEALEMKPDSMPIERGEGSITFQVKTVWPHKLILLPRGIIFSEDWIYNLRLSVVDLEDQIYRIDFKSDKNCSYDIILSNERTRFFINCNVPRTADIKFYLKTRFLFFKRRFYHDLGAVNQEGLSRPENHEFDVAPVLTKGRLSVMKVSWHIPEMTDSDFILWRAPGQGSYGMYGVGHWGPVGGLFTNEETFVDRFLRYEGQVWCYRLTSVLVRKTDHETRYYCSMPSDTCACGNNDLPNTKPLYDVGCGDWEDLKMPSPHIF